MSNFASPLDSRPRTEWQPEEREMGDDQKLYWFCGGNIPGPFSTLEELEEFVADNREGADRLLNMSAHLQQAEERSWYLKEVRDGRIARPEANASTEELEGLIALLNPSLERISQHGKSWSLHWPSLTTAIRGA